MTYRPRLFDLRRHTRAALGLTGLTVLSALSEGIGILLLVPLLEGVTGDAPGALTRALEYAGITPHLDAVLALFVAAIAFRGAVVHWRALVALGFECALVDGLRRRVWGAILHCDWRALLGLERARMSSLMISRVDQAGLYVHQAIQAAISAATLGAIGLAAIAISPALSLVAAAGGMVLLPVFRRQRRRAAELGQALGDAYAEIHSHVLEGLDALRTIRSLRREARAIDRFEHDFSGLRDARMAYQRDLGRGQIVLQVGGATAIAGLVWLASEHWGMAPSEILPIVALSARALPLFGTLQQALLACAHVRPAVLEAHVLIDLAEHNREPCNPSLDPPNLKDALRLENASVRFAPDQPPALDCVSAIIPARGVTAIIGPSGAGKSTLADVIGGLLTPDEGSFSIDRQPISGALRQAWRHRVGYVAQDPVLFVGTVRDNLIWAAPEASDDQLLAALRTAGADFVEKLPDGLECRIGNGARRLSGGECQRLILARSLLQDPALLILDEATSALDAASEKAIAEAIDRIAQRIAVVVIGHRGALLALADHTINLEAGRVVRCG